MNTSNDARLAEAARHLEAALDLLDQADAPADIGANLAHVLSRLSEQVESNETVGLGEQKKSLGAND